MAIVPVPLGPPISLSDADLDALSQITPLDIVEAQQAWRRDAPAALRGLADAVALTWEQLQETLGLDGQELDSYLKQLDESEAR